MEPIYVFGHKNPDTDSIVAAISYASLCNAMGENEYEAARLGHLNDETQFLLNRFGFQPPVRLNTVRTQISDIEYDQPPCLGANVPVSHAWALLQEHPSASALPVVTDDGHLYGMLTAGSIAEHDMDAVNHPSVTDVPLFNLLSALEGQILNANDEDFDTISGEMMIALPVPGGLPARIRKDSIVLCGDQPEVIDAALAAKAECVILCESGLADKYRDLNSTTCLISTPCDAFRASRMIFQSIPVSRIVQTENIVSFRTTDFLDDVREQILKSRYRSYPILDETGKVVGTLSRFHLIRPNRKRVVLVDHNERSQSVEGLEQAEILAILDHHRLGGVQTGAPCFMRNEPIGSTTSIIATMYQERGIMPGANLAGLMAAAILSDTVLFRSPTCTPKDKRLAERLARIAGIDLEALGKEMFSAVQADKSTQEIIDTDFKEFQLGSHKVGISQITTMDTENMLKRIDELREGLENKKAGCGYDLMLLMITDVLRGGSELVFAGDPEIIKAAFTANRIENNHLFLSGVISRKKQVVPALATQIS